MKTPKVVTSRRKSPNVLTWSYSALLAKKVLSSVLWENNYFLFLFDKNVKTFYNLMCRVAQPASTRVRTRGEDWPWPTELMRTKRQDVSQAVFSKVEAVRSRCEDRQNMWGPEGLAIRPRKVAWPGQKNKHHKLKYGHQNISMEGVWGTPKFLTLPQNIFQGTHKLKRASFKFIAWGCI